RLRVADAAVHDDAGPAVLDRQLGELVADQGAAHRGAAVDHQHAAGAGTFHRLAHEGVVLEYLQRRNRPTEGRAPAVAGKHGGNDGEFVFVGVANIGGLDVHGVSSVD